jgi:hypothetical protein
MVFHSPPVGGKSSGRPGAPSMATSKGNALS